MLSKTIEVQDATAAGMAEYVVTWQALEGTPVAVGTVDVREFVTMADGMLVVRTEEAVGAAVGFPPFRQVQALESFSGTLDQRAAYAGRVWVGAFV